MIIDHKPSSQESHASTRNKSASKNTENYLQSDTVVRTGRRSSSQEESENRSTPRTTVGASNGDYDYFRVQLEDEEGNVEREMELSNRTKRVSSVPNVDENLGLQRCESPPVHSVRREMPEEETDILSFLPTVNESVYSSVPALDGESSDNEDQTSQEDLTLDPSSAGRENSSKTYMEQMRDQLLSNGCQNVGDFTSNDLDDAQYKVARKSLVTDIHIVTYKDSSNIEGRQVDYIIQNSEMYFSIKLFIVIKVSTHSGFKKLDNILLDEYRGKSTPFLRSKGRKREWISKDAFICISSHLGEYLKLRRQRVVESIKKIWARVEMSPEKLEGAQSNTGKSEVDTNSKDGGAQSLELPLYVKSSLLTLCDIKVPVFKKGDVQIFMEFAELFAYLQLEIDIKKNTWKFVDACLSKNNISPRFAFLYANESIGRPKRTHIDILALQTLLKTLNRGNRERKKVMLAELQSFLNQPLERVLGIKKDIADVVASSDSKSDVDESPEGESRKKEVNNDIHVADVVASSGSESDVDESPERESRKKEGNNDIHVADDVASDGWESDVAESPEGERLLEVNKDIADVVASSGSESDVAESPEGERLLEVNKDIADVVASSGSESDVDESPEGESRKKEGNKDTADVVASSGSKSDVDESREGQTRKKEVNKDTADVVADSGSKSDVDESPGGETRKKEVNKDTADVVADSGSKSDVAESPELESRKKEVNNDIADVVASSGSKSDVDESPEGESRKKQLLQELATCELTKEDIIQFMYTYSKSNDIEDIVNELYCTM